MYSKHCSTNIKYTIGADIQFAHWYRYVLVCRILNGSGRCIGCLTVAEFSSYTLFEFLWMMYIISLYCMHL